MSQSDLSDGEIRQRVSGFEAEESPPDDCIYFAEYLAKYRQGAVAEEAVQRLVDLFPEDRLSELVRKYAAPTLAAGVDHCQGYPGNDIAIALGDRGFEAAQSNTGWHVSWPGGDALEGENLYRLALRAVWLRGMRSRESTMASRWGGMTATEKTRENRLRRRAKRLGLAVKKGRARKIHVNDLGGYMIVDLYRNRLVHGEGFNLDLDGLGAYLSEAGEKFGGRGKMANVKKVTLENGESEPHNWDSLADTTSGSRHG